MMQPPLYEYPTCSLRAENQGNQPVIGNPHDTRVELVALSIQKILMGSYLGRRTHNVTICSPRIRTGRHYGHWTVLTSK